MQVGEIGLDKIRKKECPMEEQRELMLQQLRIAAEFDRHVQVHNVRAFGAMIDDFKSLSKFPKSTVLHSYAGSDELVRDFTDCIFFQI